jgi:hypothetical protein
VSKFNSGTIADVAANATQLFVITKTGEMSCSMDGMRWTIFNYADHQLPSIRKIVAGEDFSLGVTNAQAVVVMRPFEKENQDDLELEHSLYDLAPLAGPIVSIVGMDASADFGCVLAEVGSKANGVATEKKPAAAA